MIGKPGNCNNNTNEGILGVLKAIWLRFAKRTVRGIAVDKSGVNKRCNDGASRVKVKNGTEAQTESISEHKEKAPTIILFCNTRYM